MKINDLKQKLHKDRPMTTVTLRMPEDVVEDLKRIAPLVGFSGYQPLMRAYIGQGMRADLERMESNPEVIALLDRLRKLGVNDEILNQAFQETFYALPAGTTTQQYIHKPYEYSTKSSLVLAEEKTQYDTEKTSPE